MGFVLVSKFLKRMKMNREKVKTTFLVEESIG